MTLCYHIHELTGAYLGSTECPESPEEPGTLLLPWMTTLIPPPQEPDKNAFWYEGRWILHERTHDSVAGEVLGLLATPASKEVTLLSWARTHMDSAAVALGFGDMNDAMSFVNPNSTGTQREQDALALRDWRNEVLKTTDSFIEAAKTTTDPVPTPEQFTRAMPLLSRSYAQVSAVLPTAAPDPVPPEHAVRPSSV